MVIRKAASMWLEVNMYYEFLWNHVVIQQDWTTLKIHEVSDFSNSQFLEKMQELFCKRPKLFANCELRTANLNPGNRDQLRSCEDIIFVAWLDTWQQNRTMELLLIT